MAEKIQTILETGSYVAVTFVAGAMAVAGVIAAFFRVGKSRIPFISLTELRLRELILEVVRQVVEPLEEQIENVYRRLDDGQRRMDEEREHRYALELEQQYLRGLEAGRKEQDRKG